MMKHLNHLYFPSSIDVLDHHGYYESINDHSRNHALGNNDVASNTMKHSGNAMKHLNDVSFASSNDNSTIYDESSNDYWVNHDLTYDDVGNTNDSGNNDSPNNAFEKDNDSGTDN